MCFSIFLLPGENINFISLARCAHSDDGAAVVDVGGGGGGTDDDSGDDGPY